MQKTKIKIVISKALCIGAQTCVVEDPEHFVMDDYEGKAFLRKDKDSELVRELELEVTEEQKAKYMKIAQLCPTQAISVFDEKNNQLFP